MGEQPKVHWLTGGVGDTDQALAMFRDSGRSRDYLVGMIAGLQSAALMFSHAPDGESMTKDVVVFNIGKGIELYAALLTAHDAAATPPAGGL